MAEATVKAPDPPTPPTQVRPDGRRPVPGARTGTEVAPEDDFWTMDLLQEGGFSYRPAPL